MQVSDKVSKFQRWMFYIGVILFTLFALSGAFFIVMQSSWGRQKIVALLNESIQESGWRIEIKEYTGSLPNEVLLRNVTIYSPRGDVINIDSIDTQLSIFELLKKEIEFKRFKADHIVWKSKVNVEPSKILTFTGVPYSIQLSQMNLSHIQLPGFDKDIQIQGQIKVGRLNRNANVQLSVHLMDIPEANAQIALSIHRNHQAVLTFDLQTPSFSIISSEIPLQGSGKIHVTGRGPWDTFLSAFFNEPSSSVIQGDIQGNAILSDLNVLTISKPILLGSWSFSSSFSIQPGNKLQFSHAVLTGESAQANGNITFNQLGEMPESSFHLLINELEKTQIPDLKGSIVLDLKNSSKEANISIHSPRIEWKHQELQNLSIQSSAIREDNRWNGDLEFKGFAFQQEWSGQSKFLWKKGSFLEMDPLSLRSAITQIDGQLKMDSDQKLEGELRGQISNIHQFDIPIYGTFDTTIRFKTDVTTSPPQQLAEIDAKGANLIYDGWQMEKGFFYADLKDPLDHPNGHAYLELQQGLWKTIRFDTITAETTGDLESSPITFHLDGEWKTPFDLTINGLWQTQPSAYSFQLQSIQGSFFNRPFLLDHSTNLAWNKNQFILDHLAFSIGESNIFINIDQQLSEINADILLSKVPMDFLSLNPLNLSVTGLIDLDAKIHQKDKEASGSIQVKIANAQIASVVEENPLSAEGILEYVLEKNRLKGHLDFQVGDTSQFHLTSDLPISLSLYPFKSVIALDQNASGSLKIDGKIEDVLDFFNLGAHRIEGNCHCDLAFSKNLSNPKFKGSCNIENGRYENYYSGFQMRNINASIIGNRQTLSLKSFSAQDSQNKGNIQLKGELKGLIKERLPFHLNGDFSRINIVDLSWMQADANGKVQIFGDLDSAHIQGEVLVQEGDLSIPDQLPHPLPNLQVQYVNTIKPIPIEVTPAIPVHPYPVFLDLSISASDSIVVSGRGLNSEWKGNFELRGTYRDIEAKGQLSLIQGSFAFSGRSIHLSEGTLTFSGKPHEMPSINLAGEMDLQNLKIIARLVGPIDGPQLAFQSVPPLPMGSIVSQLLFGQDLSDVNTMQAAQIVNSLATFSPSDSKLLSNTKRSIGIDRLRIIAPPTTEEGSQSMSVQVGKYVTRGVLVSVSQGAEGGTTNFSIEVDLTNGIVFQAESMQEEEQGKFTIKWNLNY